jgi:two-component sensor histidine kinase
MGEGTGRFGFIFFILPIVASGLLFDRGTGLFAMLLSVGLLTTILDWGPSTAANLSAITVFVIVGTCLVYVSEGLHRALEQADAARTASNLLLQEMSHRVKNKFAMVSSIIALQARSSTPEVREALNDVASRVNIIATVHNYLQLSRHDGLINMAEYLPKLCQALHEALCGPRPISIHSAATTVELPPEKALAVGVIVNELITNTFKYAFETEAPGHIEVELTRNDGGLQLSVTDNGKGCGEKKSGLGTRLITLFAAQLNGEAVWEQPPGGGCRATVRFAA